jgi:hypothetical protein
MEALLDFPDARGDRLHDRHAQFAFQRRNQKKRFERRAQDVNGIRARVLGKGLLDEGGDRAGGTSGMDLNSTPIPSMATTPIPLSFCIAPLAVRRGPLWVSQRHQSMSASATAFADSGHRGPPWVRA